MSFDLFGTRLSLTLTADADVKITTHHDPATGPGSLSGAKVSASWVAVRTGPILTYCYDPDAAAVRVAAWTNALAKARRVLPSYPAVAAGTDPLQLVAQLAAHGGDAWTVTGFGAGGARDGVPVLYVRTGVLTIGCYDQPTVVALRDIWARAATFGQILWRESERLSLG